MCLVLLASSIMPGCTSGDREPPARAFFEEYFIGGLLLESNEQAFKAIFRSAVCKAGGRAYGKLGHKIYRVCKPYHGAYRREKMTISFPEADPWEITHYEAVFFRSLGFHALSILL